MTQEEATNWAIERIEACSGLKLQKPWYLEAFKAILHLAKYADGAFNPDIIKICDTAIRKAENEH